MPQNPEAVERMKMLEWFYSICHGHTFRNLDVYTWRTALLFLFQAIQQISTENPNSYNGDKKGDNGGCWASVLFTVVNVSQGIIVQKCDVQQHLALVRGKAEGGHRCEWSAVLSPRTTNSSVMGERSQHTVYFFLSPMLKLTLKKKHKHTTLWHISYVPPLFSSTSPSTAAAEQHTESSHAQTKKSYMHTCLLCLTEVLSS